MSSSALNNAHQRMRTGTATKKNLGVQRRKRLVIYSTFGLVLLIIYSVVVIFKENVHILPSSATLISSPAQQKIHKVLSRLQYSSNSSITDNNENWLRSFCPVKVFVHDLGFKARTSSLEKGFRAKVQHHGNISQYTTRFSSMEHGMFILQKFIFHSPCVVEDAREADFIILPLANINAGELDRIVQLLERDHNSTLFRRAMKDHVIPGLQNTRKSYQMASALSKRTHEWTTPMIKLVVDIWGWWYHFSAYHTYTTPAQLFMYYDRIMTVPYASSVFNFTGDIIANRKYLASFAGNVVYPKYRKEISDQCLEAMEGMGDCFVGASNRSHAAESLSYDLYLNSTFFFCPAGDSGPRKALFDGIAANSIPVVFDETSFELQYSYYFPNPRDYSVFMNSTEDMMSQLRDIPQSRIVELQKNIAFVRTSVAYLQSRYEKDATWMILKQLEEYKRNGYKFLDRWAGRSEYKCLERKCRFA